MSLFLEVDIKYINAFNVAVEKDGCCGNTKKYYFKTLIALLNKAIKDVLQVLNGVSYVYFTSNKSSLIELMNWIDVNKTIGNPFKKAVRKETSKRIAHNAEYKDIMLYKTAA